MNPDDLIKAAPAIAKVAGPLAAVIPLTPIIKAILGDAADELGQRFGDRVRLYRYGRSLDMLKKAEKMAQDAGYTPKAVPIKLLFPLLEGASFEENEDLHTMWAAFLANAASAKDADKVRPAFIATLKQMAQDEAALLNWMFAQRVGFGDAAFQVAAISRVLEVQTASQPVPFDAPFSHGDLVDAFCLLGFGKGPILIESGVPAVRLGPGRPSTS
jgi:Abortive infection alpha